MNKSKLITVACLFIGSAACSKGGGETDTGSDSTETGLVDDTGTTTDTGATTDTGNTTEAPPLTLTTGLHTFIHDGLQREYYIHIPPSYEIDAPLMLVFHGYSGSYMSVMSYSSMNNQANTNGFVVVYPQGTKDRFGYNFFNVGYTFHENLNIDDLGFTKALVDYVATDLGLNRDEVFSTGMSNGGDMSYYLACFASDVFRAVAPIAGTMMSSTYDTCAPTKEIPIFAVNGTSDGVTWYDGDMNDIGGWGPYLGVDAIIEYWADQNNLDQTEVTTLPNTDPTDGSIVNYNRHFSNNSDTEVWLYSVERGGHDWPGYDGNMDFDTSAEIWRFFSLYTRP